MNKMKKIIALLLALVMLFSFAACGGKGDTKTPPASGNEDTQTPTDDKTGDKEPALAADRNGDGKVTIAYSAIAYSIAVLPQFLYSNLEANCKERGWEFLPLAAEGDAALQGEQVEQLIQQDPDYFVLFPADPKLAVDWVTSIADAGIPCITLHTDVAEEGRENVMAYCGPNNYQMAADIAKAIIERNGADAGLKIIEIGGVPVQSDYIERVAGFDEYIKANSNYEILGIEWAYSNRADAQSYVENFISTYGDQINVLMGFDDDLTLGGVNAFKAANMTDVQVYSITGQKEAIQAIKDGSMTLTAYYSTADTCAEVFNVIEKLAAGEEVEYFHYTNTPHITAENADQFEGEF
jgi:ABC-type sugar transport system substrate-binding protein